MNVSKVVIVDADALIALFNRDDAHFEVALKTLEDFSISEYILVFPATAVIEAVTTLQRKLNKKELVDSVLELMFSDNFHIESVDLELLIDAYALFDPLKSKQNTLFDAIVAATAKRYGTNLIFSFDKWYKSLNLT